MSAFSQALAIAIASIFGFGLVAHRVLISVVEQKFAKLELSILKTRSEVLESQKEIRELESEIKDLKTLILMQIEKKKGE